MKLIIPTPIVHQQQPTKVSCVATCLAMVLGVPVESKLLKSFQSLYERGFTTPYLYLKDGFNITNMRRCYTDEVLGAEARSVYLALVPHLNLAYQLHAVILDCRGDSVVIFDPNYGKLDSVSLKNYCLEVELEYEG